jgi:excisionase family DNA binding protein
MLTTCRPKRMSARKVCTSQNVRTALVAFDMGRALIRRTSRYLEALMTTRRTYTVPEVAEMLGISRSTAYVCIRRGEIPSLALGRRVVISKMAFDAFLAAHTPATTAIAEKEPRP